MRAVAIQNTKSYTFGAFRLDEMPLHDRIADRLATDVNSSTTLQYSRVEVTGKVSSPTREESGHCFRRGLKVLHRDSGTDVALALRRSRRAKSLVDAVRQEENAQAAKIPLSLLTFEEQGPD